MVFYRQHPLRNKFFAPSINTLVWLVLLREDIMFKASGLVPDLMSNFNHFTILDSRALNIENWIYTRNGMLQLYGWSALETTMILFDFCGRLIEFSGKENSLSFDLIFRIYLKVKRTESCVQINYILMYPAVWLLRIHFTSFRNAPQIVNLFNFT